MYALPELRLEARALLRLAIPVSLGQLSTVGMHLSDAALVGHYDSTALAGMALGGALAMTGYLVALGIVLGIGPMITQAEGAGDKPACGKALAAGLWLAGLLSLILMGIMSQSRALLILSGQTEQLATVASSWVQFYALGYPGLLGFMTLRQLVEGLGHPRVPMLVSFFGLAINVPLNYVLLYGHLGLPAMGVAGTGLATAIAQTLTCVIMAWHILRSPRYRAYGLEALRHLPSWQTVSQALHIGVPVGLSLAMEAGTFTAVGLLMGWFGKESAGGHQIALNLCSFSFMVPLGLGMAASIRVGQAAGRQDPQAIRRTGWVTLVLAVSFMGLMGILYASEAPWLIGLYTEDAAVIRMGAALLLWGAAFQVFDGAQVVGNALLRGMKDTRVPMLANFCSYWVIGLPLAWYLAMQRGWGPAGLWAGLTAGLGLAALAHSTRFHHLTRRAAQAARGPLPGTVLPDPTP